MDTNENDGNKKNEIVYNIKDNLQNEFFRKEILEEEINLHDFDRKLETNNNLLNLSEMSSLGKRVMKMKFEKKPIDYHFSLNDLNNFCGADRKIIINDSYEFWVHDTALITNSNYFKEILQGIKKASIRQELVRMNNITYREKHTSKKTKLFLKSDENKSYVEPQNNLINLNHEEISQKSQNLEKDHEKNEAFITKTFLYVPHPDHFFDILTWIYSKDADRLALSADEPESFLCILNLGIFLEMSDIFFQALLEKCQIIVNEELLNHHLWSRFSFTFDVLKIFLRLIPEQDFYLKIDACLSWLKEDNTLKQSRSDQVIPEREIELMTSKEFFVLKNFLSEKKYLENLSVADLYKIKIKFPKLIPALDAMVIIEKYIEKSGMKITCKICKKSSSSIQEFVKNDCEAKFFHPKNFCTLQRNLPNSCEHEGCTKKLVINEYPCCHKALHFEGCMLNDNRIHILNIEFLGDKKEEIKQDKKEENKIN